MANSQQNIEEASPESGRIARSAPPPSLSAQLWDIDWARLLPLTLADDGLTANYASFEQIRPFVAQHYASIFEEGEHSPFQAKPHAKKARYMELTADFVEFSLRGETIGLFIGMPSDWSTYYIRSAALLPEHQGRAAAQSFFRALFPILQRHGVERVELDTSPANLAMMQIVTRLRFNPTGTTLSDRWGALVRFSKYLDADCEDTFLRQFCGGVKYQSRGRERGS